MKSPKSLPIVKRIRVQFIDVDGTILSNCMADVTEPGAIIVGPYEMGGIKGLMRGINYSPRNIIYPDPKTCWQAVKDKISQWKWERRKKLCGW